MNMLIFNRPDDNEENLVGEFTFFCDTFTIVSPTYINERRQKAGFCTYVLEPSYGRENLYAIRFPGATRGHIEVDKDNIIIDIIFYTDSGIAGKASNNVGIYKEDIREAAQKYIGRKIVIQ